MDHRTKPAPTNATELVEAALRQNGFDCSALDWLDTPAADALGGYLHVVEIVMTVEVEADINIPDEAFDPETITLEGLVKLVDKYLP